MDVSSVYTSTGSNNQNTSSQNNIIETPKRVRFMNDTSTLSNHNDHYQYNSSTTAIHDHEKQQQQQQQQQQEHVKQSDNLKHHQRNRSTGNGHQLHGDDSEITRKKNEYISSLFPNSASPIENLSYDGSSSSSDSVDVHNGNDKIRMNMLDNVPLPPFSPGVPGLISPLPRKLKFGVSPPPHPPKR